jgi:hypothetical protein
MALYTLVYNFKEIESYNDCHGRGVHETPNDHTNGAHNNSSILYLHFPENAQQHNHIKYHHSHKQSSCSLLFTTTREHRQPHHEVIHEWQTL